MADEKPDKIFHVNPDGSGDYELRSVPKPAESVAPVTFDDLPESHEELDEDVKEYGIRTLAKAVRIGERIADQVAKMDMGRENPSILLTALGKCMQQIATASQMISETTPRTTNMYFQYPMPTADKSCPICGKEQPDKDVSGFDDIPDEDEDG